MRRFWSQGQIQGGPGGPAPLFLAVNFVYIVYTLYNVWKNIFEIEFWFYSGRNPMSFWKCGGCMHVCVCLCESIGLHDKSVVFLSNIGGFRNRGRYCLLFCKGPILIQRPFWSPKYMPDCRKLHLIFQKNFWGKPPDPPPALGSGLHPLTGPPFQNSWICPWIRWKRKNGVNREMSGPNSVNEMCLWLCVCTDEWFIVGI